MKSFLFSLAAKTGLFAIALGSGMLGYLLVHEGGGGKGTASATVPSVSPRAEIALDAEPHLLARVESPVDAAGDALGIFYILQADGGMIRVAPEVGGGHAAATYAKLSDGRTEASGFSGLALHPHFLLSEQPGYGRFYILVSEKAGAKAVDFIPEFGGPGEHHQDVLYEYTVEDPLLTEFRGTRRELMRFRQPGPDHNVRGLAFDLQGFLHLGVGDGAAETLGKTSSSRNASSLANAYGKVLRIDPLGSNSSNGQYGIPEGNPFRLVTDALPELWAFGLRAPGSLAYDPFQRGLCIAEEARPGREEIKFSLHGAEHFGWDIVEDAGRLSRTDRARLAEVVTEPAAVLDGDTGTAGGFVYRGEHFPSLAGALLFASRDGRLLSLRSGDADAPGRLAKVDLGRFGEQGFSALRQGPRGELIFLCGDGSVFEMRKGASLGTGASAQRSLFCEAGSGVPKVTRL